MQENPSIKAIIGLGNPGKKYAHTRHNIGFKVVDLLAQDSRSSWKSHDHLEWISVPFDDHDVLLIKPQTGMNICEKVIPFLQKKGIAPEQILVVHDELELPFGTIKLKQGGSARGHNGLRSLINGMGPDFYRVRVGIGRPKERDQVGEYVLSSFDEPREQVDTTLTDAVEVIKNFIAQ